MVVSKATLAALKLPRRLAMQDLRWGTAGRRAQEGLGEASSRPTLSSGLSLNQGRTLTMASGATRLRNGAPRSFIAGFGAREVNFGGNDGDAYCLLRYPSAFVQLSPFTATHCLGFFSSPPFSTSFHIHDSQSVY